MSPLTATPLTRTLLTVLVGVALLAAAPAAASAHEPIHLHFQKVCMPSGSCTGTLLTATGRPIGGTSVSAFVGAAVGCVQRDRLLRDRDDRGAERVVHDEPPRDQRHERHA